MKISVKIVSCKKKIVQKISFNINLSYKKPTVVLKAPNDRHGSYSLERTLGFSFPCFATIYFTVYSGIDRPLKLRYYTSMSAGKSVRIAVVGGSSKNMKRTRKKGSELVFDADRGDGWCFMNNNKKLLCL